MSDPWQPIETFDGTGRVDLWLHIKPSPRTMGNTISHRVPDACRKDGKWTYQVGTKDYPLVTEEITHWMRQPAPPLL